MSYEPTNWKAGDTVTSAKLNKIEQGVATNCADFIYEIPADESGEYLVSAQPVLPSTLNDYLKVPWTYEEFINKFEQGKMLTFKIPISPFQNGNPMFMQAIQQTYLHTGELYGIYLSFIVSGASFFCYATSPTEPMIITVANDENILRLLGINTGT